MRPCKHDKFTRTMEWPDGGTSELCESCLKTRHIDEISETEWQNHKYASVADWYKEAEGLQRGMEKILNRDIIKGI